LVLKVFFVEMDSGNLKPGVVRNDFYVCLERAEVQQEGFTLKSKVLFLTFCVKKKREKNREKCGSDDDDSKCERRNRSRLHQQRQRRGSARRISNCRVLSRKQPVVDRNGEGETIVSSSCHLDLDLDLKFVFFGFVK
jgi:hypothetical protein